MWRTRWLFGRRARADGGATGGDSEGVLRFWCAGAEGGLPEIERNLRDWKVGSYTTPLWVCWGRSGGQPRVQMRGLLRVCWATDSWVIRKGKGGGERGKGGGPKRRSLPSLDWLCEARDRGAGSSVARKWLERRGDDGRARCEGGKAAVEGGSIEESRELRVNGDGAVILEITNLQVKPLYLSVELLFMSVHTVKQPRRWG